MMGIFIKIVGKFFQVTSANSVVSTMKSRMSLRAKRSNPVKFIEETPRPRNDELCYVVTGLTRHW